jgi:PAS domain S-box-containing protein
VVEAKQVFGQAFFKAVLDTAVEGIVVIDSRGDIELFNRAAQKMFGYSAREVLGKNISILMPEPYRSAHDGYIGRYIATGKAKIIGVGREAVGMRKNKSIFPIELAVSEVKVGSARRFVGLVKDITEKKRLEKEVLDVSEREQRRIGQELHDGVCQELAGIAFQVQSVKQKLESSGVADKEEMSQVVELLQSAMRRARGLSHGLYPVDPSPAGLRLALQQLAAVTTDTAGISCVFDCEHPVEFHDASVATHLYRIAQEAVRDAVRHGRARHIRIRLSSPRGNLVSLCVSDDGIDLAQDGRMRTDMVLRLMEHRASVIGAKLQVHSNPGEGVSVLCELNCNHGHK